MPMLPDSVEALNTPKDCDFSALSEDTLLFEKEHAYVGRFQKGDEPEFELTEEAIRHFAKESQRYIDNGNQCNLPVEHTTDPEKNRGKNLKWYAKHDSKGRLGLFSLTEFRDAEAAKLARTAQTSIYCPPKHKDGAKNEYVRAVRHVALTDYPVIPGLDNFTPIAASLVEPVSNHSNPSKNKKETTMPIKSLAANIGLQLSEDVLKDEELTLSEVEKTIKGLQSQILELSEYKKKNPPVTPPADPVRVSKSQIAMLRENRELKLSQLVKEGKILTCVAKKLESTFCGEQALSLCLSEDAEDNFNVVVDALRDNDPIKLSEVTGPQARDMSKLLDAGTNPMIANAKKRAAAVN